MTTNNKICKEHVSQDLDQVVDQLKCLDQKNKRLMQRMFIVYVVFALFYFGLLIFNPDPELTLANRIQGACYVLIFTVAACFFLYHSRKTYKVDYTEPVLKMLETARERHRLMRPGKAWFVFFIVTVTDGVVTWALVPDIFPNWSLAGRILFIQANYFALMGISFLIGYLVWRRKSLPLVRNLTRVIDEMRRDETPMNDIV